MFPSLAWFAEVISQPFKRSQNGLFHGKMKQYGNNVPFSKHKTRRTWLPNVHSKRLFSDALGKELKLKVTARALRTIKKHGSLDKYLVKTSAEQLGQEGLRLRIMVSELRRKQFKEMFETRTQEKQIRREQHKEHMERLEQKRLQASGREKLARKKVQKVEVQSPVPEPEPELVLGDAIRVREEAGKALGLVGPASATQTIEYLRSTNTMV